MFRVHISAVVQRGGKLLLVREEKPENHGKWNLPGGHLEEGEALQEGVVRELREETLLHGEVTHLLGVYASTRAVRPSLQLVFGMDAESGEPQAGDQILEVGWFTPQEILALPDESLVGATKLRAILGDLEAGVRLPLPWEAESSPFTTSS
jgi:8-oxo-dGTP diphosphatase